MRYTASLYSGSINAAAIQTKPKGFTSLACNPLYLSKQRDRGVVSIQTIMIFSKLQELAIAPLICVAIAGCSDPVVQELSPQLTEAKPSVSSQLPADNLTTRKRQQWNSGPILENSQPVSVELPASNESQIENSVPLEGRQLQGANSQQLVQQGSYMTLTLMGRTNAQGNPLYQMNLYVNGQLMRTYAVVSGRAYSQNRDRHQAGTQAPLPDGLYAVAGSAVRGTSPEVGSRFLPIQPLFRTGRSALGIHYDPSFEKNNGEDGTEGCIALTNKSDLDDLLNYVRIYRPKYLQVNIQ